MNNVQKETSFTFDLNAYDLTSIKKAAYRFSGDYLIDIITVGTVATVTAKKIQAEQARWDIENLPNEVLDQELREIVLKETQVMRDVILAQAFSNVAILNTEYESSDFQGDPLGISKSNRQEKNSE